VHGGDQGNQSKIVVAMEVADEYRLDSAWPDVLLCKLPLCALSRNLLKYTGSPIAGVGQFDGD
jgi:hypothetical protein